MWFGKGAETEGSGGRGRDNRGEEDWRSKRGFFFTFTRIDELALHWSHWILSTVEICAIAHRAIP